MDEYIEREAVLTLIQKLFDTTQVDGEEQIGVLKCHRIVREHPAADVVEVKHGRWIKRHNERTCSECQFIYYNSNDDFNYCPNCGAKMDGKPQKEV